MILWVFIEFFGVKIVITDILPIFYRYFFRNSSTCTRVPQLRFFGGKIGIFRFFNKKLRRFFDFRLSFAKIFSIQAENRFFDDISAEKSDYFVLNGTNGTSINRRSRERRTIS